MPDSSFFNTKSGSELFKKMNPNFRGGNKHRGEPDDPQHRQDRRRQDGVQRTDHLQVQRRHLPAPDVEDDI